MKQKCIKFYPVDNGDTTLITLGDNSTILVDCKIRDGEENNAGATIFDVKTDLLNNVQNRGGIPYIDTFILTHPDEDHCLGFMKHFYSGSPEDIGDKNKDADEIMVDELWVTSMLFDGATNDDAKALKKEAGRRQKLWHENNAMKNEPGNRIRMIGYNGDEKYENLPSSIPGTTISTINGKTFLDFEFFVHAPFRQSLITESADEDKNFSSIVMQAAFKQNITDSSWTSLYLFGGDADHNRWAEVLKQSKAHRNEDRLLWDILQTPHHCSWTFFNDVPYAEPEEHKTPKRTSLELLDYSNDYAKIIASCKVIKNNDNNPPHFQARKQYLNKVGDDNFLNTASEPKEKKPEPIVFEVTSSGFNRVDEGAKADRLRNVAKGIQAGTVGTAGSGRLSAKEGEFTQHQPHRFYGE